MANNNSKYVYKVKPFYIIVAAFVVVMAIVATLLLNTYAKYIMTDNSDDTARTAKFIIEDNGSMYTQAFALEVDPTETASVDDALSVVNNSEVDVRCLITVDSTANLPLIFKWTDEDGNTSSAPANEAASFDLDTNGDSAVYDLEVTWDESDKSFIYRRQVDSLKLTVRFEQID